MIREAQFYIVDAFTRTRFQGNPAGVVFATSPLDEEDMMKVAAELHLETAFLWPAVSAAAQSSIRYSICYYTQVARIPLCGHDTIAAGIVLAARGEIGNEAALLSADSAAAGPVASCTIFMSDIGELPIELLPDGAISMRQALPRYGEAVDVADVVNALGVSRGNLTAVPSRVVSTGTPFLFIGVDTAATVDSLSPGMPALAHALQQIDQKLTGVYVWADDRVGATQTIYGRCFAPGTGLSEDPVTGSASGALGAHLFDLGILRASVDGIASIQTTQGRAMGRPGNAYVTLIASGGQVASVSVAGHGAIVGEGTLRV